MDYLNLGMLLSVDVLTGPNTKDHKAWTKGLHDVLDKPNIC